MCLIRKALCTVYKTEKNLRSYGSAANLKLSKIGTHCYLLALLVPTLFHQFCVAPSIPHFCELSELHHSLGADTLKQVLISHLLLVFSLPPSSLFFLTSRDSRKLNCALLPQTTHNCIKLCAVRCAASNITKCSRNEQTSKQLADWTCR